eukprot:TRINITY_DN2050_c0_g6_i2.p1 TRINITY_DN2050_c0_g6~~TRINITY_DN2050_c0_g6_i2.p1  ORF type:complete len:1034 (+),score=272.65 TRINITY_DN2050_c0_g6_i2:380-3481(+)
MKLLLLLALLGVALGSRYELLNYNPVANPNAVVISGNARFTVLTPSLIRMEYGNGGKFEDRATPAFVNRNLTVPSFTTNTQSGSLYITTSSLVLRYTIGAPFNSSTLSVRSIGSTSPSFNWFYGTPDTGNLLGTVRSLDMVGVIPLNCTQNANITVHDESLHCEWGVISKAGWSVIDDTQNWGLNSNDWWDTPNTDQVDLYFFGHGHNYKQALKDFTSVAGKIAMTPRYASGIWWSRWYNLDNADVQQVVMDYVDYSVPLDVYILDMDWHTKEGWGGYSVDTRLFPYPSVTFGWLHDHGLHVGANIHDDDGVRPTETMYPELAHALGISNNSTIPFSAINPSYMYGLEDIVLADVEREGMDFWWIDWQQGGKEGGCKGGKQNPTIWLNKLRGTDHIRRKSALRGLILSRFGGLGSHRYQVGFSGDVDELSWQNLAFQPYFSLTASNVGYGFWSHDLVGPHDDHELHTRWLQWGAYSGVFRTHDRGMAVGGCADTNPPSCSIIEIWNVPQQYFKVNREAVRGRSELIPYIYTAVRQAYDTGISLIRPMYYEFPEIALAYAADPQGNYGQYMFGDNIMVSPITSPADNTSMATGTIWIPPGIWVEKDTGYLHTGSSSTVLQKKFDLSEIPVFVRGGSIIPGVPLQDGNIIGVAQRQYTTLTLTVYPGNSSGQTTIYEDDGMTTDYVSGKSVNTLVDYQKTSSKFTLTVHKAVGSYPEFPKTRNYIVRIVNHLPVVSGSVNGLPISYSVHGGANTWRYDASRVTTIIETPFLPTSSDVNVVITTNPVNDTQLSGLRGIFSHSTLAKRLLDQANAAPGTFSVTGGSLSKVASASNELSYLAGKDIGLFTTLLNNIPQMFVDAVNEIQSVRPNPPPPASALVQLWNAGRQDNCLCGSSSCLSTNSDYDYVRIEGYQPPAGTPGTVRLNDFWNDDYQDNWATTQSSTPSGYTPAIFGDGLVFSSKVEGTSPLILYWNEDRKDMLTVASLDGIHYAKSNGYVVVNKTLGYVYTQPPTTQASAVNYDRWNYAWNLLLSATN